jgi:hypothetical protein
MNIVSVWSGALEVLSVLGGWIQSLLVVVKWMER